MRVQENLAREFDVFSNDYTRDMINCVPHYESLMHSVVNNIEADFDVHQILDLGCGNGNLTDLLLARYPNARYTLVDASPEMLKICQERFPNAALQVFKGYFDEYDFEPGKLDLVTASFSLHHVDSNEKARLFEKIYKGLRSGGMFATCDLMIHKTHSDHPDLIKEWDTFVNGNHTNDEKWKWIMEHYEAFDRPDHYDDQIAWLKNAGFADIRITWQKGFWVSLQAVK